MGYKTYLRDGEAGYNNTYKSQLLQDLKCNEESLAKVKKLEYKQKALTQFFEEYAQCKGKTIENYTKREKETITLKFRAIAGFNYSTLTVTNERLAITEDFGGKVSLALGAELEVFLPSPRQEWAVVFQPGFTSYSASGDLREDIDVKYNALVASFGVRKYWAITDINRVFLGAYLNLNSPTVDRIPLRFFSGGLSYSTETNLSLSTGVEINEKLSVELKYGFPRDVLAQLVSWEGKFQNTTLQLRYRIFD